METDQTSNNKTEKNNVIPFTRPTREQWDAACFVEFVRRCEQQARDPNCDTTRGR